MAHIHQEIKICKTEHLWTRDKKKKRKKIIVFLSQQPLIGGQRENEKKDNRTKWLLFFISCSQFDIGFKRCANMNTLSHVDSKQTHNPIAHFSEHMTNTWTGSYWTIPWLILENEMASFNLWIFFLCSQTFVSQKTSLPTTLNCKYWCECLKWCRIAKSNSKLIRQSCSNSKNRFKHRLLISIGTYTRKQTHTHTHTHIHWLTNRTNE